MEQQETQNWEGDDVMEYLIKIKNWKLITNQR